MIKIVFILSVILIVCYARKGFGPGEQDWGYVEVRPKSHMFWWLYETTATEKPLVVWLQGGPGGSSTSHGNFEELGLLDLDLNYRNTTWVKHVNVLFIDNPVGTGFSYVENLNDLATTNNQIALDLIACILGFYERNPLFRKLPLYIAGESYGGKMAVELAYEVSKLTGNKTINLKGVYLTASTISNIDSILSWGSYLYHLGAVDYEGCLAIDKIANESKKAFDDGEFDIATDLWLSADKTVMDVAKNVDFFNILTRIKASKPEDADDDYEKLNKLMNGPVKEALKLNITHNAQSEAIFPALHGDFVKPVTHLVEHILNVTAIKVVVITGQLDLIVSTPGTIKWVDNLRWKDADNWRKASRDALVLNGFNEGYQKKYGNFQVYWVNRAGHMILLDNPGVSIAILNDIIGVKPT